MSDIITSGTRRGTTVTLAELEALTLEKDYVPAAPGLTAGDVGEGVEQLQRYLSAFGYLPSSSRDDGTAEFAAAEAATVRAQPGVFDDTTHEALRRFQEFNELPVTGELDAATVALMSRPRCGFPDAPVGEFTLQGSKWPKTALTYGYQNFTPDLTQAQVRGAISQAFGLWAAVTPLTFTEVPVASNPDIVIRFVAGDHGDGFPFDGASGVLAHAFFPPPGGGALAGDTHFDESEPWSVNLPPSGVDLVTVAAHEFGHALGLAHSNVSGALMAPFYGGPHRNLEADDIAGIRALYGSQSTGWGPWTSLGGVLTSGPDAAAWASNRLDTFVRGTDNALWHKFWNGSTWSGWSSLGGVLTSGPGAVSPALNRLEVFVRGTDNAVWRKAWNGSSWSGWSSLGGVITSDPAAASWAGNRVDLVARGSDNALWHKFWTGSAWSGWSSLGGVCTSGPAAVSWGANRLDVFVRGSDNALWHKFWNGGAWSGWSSLGGVLTSDPAACSWGPNRLDVFVRGSDNALWHKFWNGAAWSGWSSLGGVLTSSPGAEARDANKIDVFVRGTDNALWTRRFG